MGGFIIFPDGRAWAPSNALYDDAIEEIAAALPPSAEGHALSAWLLDRRSAVQGPGLGRVDLRELTATNRRLLLDTITVFPAVPLAELRAQSPAITLTEPIDWFLVDRFQLLGHMVAAVRRGPTRGDQPAHPGTHTADRAARWPWVGRRQFV